MAIVNPPGWLENSGRVNTAQQLRSYLGLLMAGTRSAITDLIPRGGIHWNIGARYSVEQTSIPSMAIVVRSGIAAVPGTEAGTQGTYIVMNDGDVTLSINAAHTSLPRIDLVQIRVRDSFYSGSTDSATVEVKTGTPASSPVAPLPDANSLALAEVLVPANATSITNANITDRRFYLAATGGVMMVESTDSNPPPSGAIAEGQLWYSTVDDKINIYDGVNHHTVWSREWISYTPTWTSTGTAPSLGNGTLIGRYIKIGKLVHVFIRLTWGSTTSAGTGDYSFSLPFTPAWEWQPISGMVRDSSASFYYPIVGYTGQASSSVARMGAHNSTGAIGRVGATHPITWADGDNIAISGIYQAQ